MRTLSKIAPIALLVGALLFTISPPAGADRRINQIGDPIIPDPPGASSDPEVPNQAYRPPAFSLTGERPVDLDPSPEVRAVLSEAWYRRLLQFVSAQFRGGGVR